MSRFNEKINSRHIQVAHKAILDLSDSKLDIECVVDLLFNGKWSDSCLSKLSTYNQDVKREIIKKVHTQITTARLSYPRILIKALGQLWMTSDDIPWIPVLRLHPYAWRYVLYELEILFDQYSKEELHRLLDLIRAVASDKEMWNHFEFHDCSILSFLLIRIEKRALKNNAMEDTLSALLDICVLLENYPLSFECVLKSIKDLYLNSIKTSNPSVTLYQRLVMAHLHLLLQYEMGISIELLEFLNHLMEITHFYDASSVRAIIVTVCFILIQDNLNERFYIEKLVQILELALVKLLPKDGQSLMIILSFYPLYKVQLDEMCHTLTFIIQKWKENEMNHEFLDFVTFFIKNNHFDCIKGCKEF